MVEIANIREQCSWVHKDKRTATENRRSMTQQALWCFDWCMQNMGTRPDFPPPVRPEGSALTLAEIDAAKKEGRP